MSVTHNAPVKVRGRLGAGGFTFFTDPNGGPDVFVTGAKLREAGFNGYNLKQGTHALVDYHTNGDGRRRVTAIHKIGEQRASTPLSGDKRPKRRQRKQGLKVGASAVGKVKYIKWEKSYGFITHEGVDYFFHMSEVVSELDRSLIVEGAEFEFVMVCGREGRTAAVLRQLVSS